MAHLVTFDAHLAHMCVFFLGGHDLEMVAIRELLDACGCEVCDRGLRWGAKASEYWAEIEAALAGGKTPVLVELEDDLDLLSDVRVRFVDHHGAQAGADQPCSLEQVFALLGLPAAEWTRRFTLIAANDKAHLRGLAAAGATPEEMRALREADRQAQGVAPMDEADALRAVQAREETAGGRLTILRLNSARTSAAADAMEPMLGGPGFQNLLLVSPGEFNFFGSDELVRGLGEVFPGGWSGGALPEFGFWGIIAPQIAPETVIAALLRLLG